MYKKLSMGNRPRKQMSPLSPFAKYEVQFEKILILANLAICTPRRKQFGFKHFCSYLSEIQLQASLVISQKRGFLTVESGIWFGVSPLIAHVCTTFTLQRICPNLSFNRVQPYVADLFCYPCLPAFCFFFMCSLRIGTRASVGSEIKTS